MKNKMHSHQKDLIIRLKDPKFQREYLRAAIEENADMPQAILAAIRNIGEAKGFQKFAQEAGLSENALYKILNPSKAAKPRFETIVQLISALGLSFTIKPTPKSKAG